MLSPVRKLPPEILQVISKHVCEANEIGGSTAIPALTLAACSHWSVLTSSHATLFFTMRVTLNKLKAQLRCHKTSNISFAATISAFGDGFSIYRAFRAW